MTETIVHDASRWELHVFERVGANDKGAGFIARFYPYKKCVLIWSGDSRDDVISKAEAFRFDLIVRQENIQRKRLAKRKEVMENEEV